MVHITHVVTYLVRADIEGCALVLGHPDYISLFSNPQTPQNMKAKIVPINTRHESVVYLDRLPELNIKKLIEKLHKNE